VASFPAAHSIVNGPRPIKSSYRCLKEQGFYFYSIERKNGPIQTIKPV